MMENGRWIICWRDECSQRVGALICPGDGSEQEAREHILALSAIFPERAFWAQPDRRKSESDPVVIEQ